MKTVAFFSMIFFAVCSLSAQTGYTRADSVAKAFDQSYGDAADLAHKLTGPFNTEEEKARVIFAWIAHNIRYDYKKFKDPPPKPRITGRTPRELSDNIRKWEENEIKNTLRSKKGVCEDYSRLFQKMCASVGLESAVVTGDSRKPNGKVGRDHAWNAVKTGGQWRLLDATWGAGYIDDDDERFVRRYAPAFFATPPALFILNHLPDDDKWQLLDKPVAKKDFSKQPLINFSHPDYPIKAFYPENGKITPAEGKAEVRLQLGAMPTVFVVAANKTKEIPVQLQKKDDGWVVLTFSPGRASEINVFVGESRRKTTMLAAFAVE